MAILRTKCSPPGRSGFSVASLNVSLFLYNYRPRGFAWSSISSRQCAPNATLAMLSLLAESWTWYAIATLVVLARL